MGSSFYATKSHSTNLLIMAVGPWRVSADHAKGEGLIWYACAENEGVGIFLVFPSLHLPQFMCVISACCSEADKV